MMAPSGKFWMAIPRESANAYMPAEGLALSVVEDTYTHTTETEKYDPVKNDSSSSSSGSSTDSDGFGGSSGGKF